MCSFVRKMRDALNSPGAPIYRRGGLVVTPYEDKRRLDVMSGRAFLSWLENNVVCYKTRYDSNGYPLEVLRSMPRDVAETVLAATSFWTELPEVEVCKPLPTLRTNADGALVELEPGYNAESKTFTFGSMSKSIIRT